jgi:hypothetical protein
MAYLNKIERFVLEASLLNMATGETYNISEDVTDINVRKNYITSSFPLVVINIITTEEIRNIMRDNDVSVKLKVSKYSDFNQEGDQDSSSITIEDVIMNTVIRSYKKPFVATDSKNEDDNEDKFNKSDTMKFIPYQIVGIPEDLIQKNKIVVNEVYENSRMDEILVHLLSQAENQNIYIDPSDNIEREQSLLIPPMNIVPAIRYLQEVYGVYNAGLSIFFDFDKTYLFKLYKESRDYKNTLEIISLAPGSDNSIVEFTTPQIDESNNVKLYLTVPPPFVSLDKINKDSLGQTTVFNSYDYNFDTVKRIYDQETNNGKTRYFWNSSQNSINEESFINETLKSSEGIMVTLKSISPSYFNIDTLYTVNTPSGYANGQYILNEISFSIYTRDYKTYDSIIGLRLSKK